MIDYRNYIQLEDLRKRGYNLEQDGVLEVSHFDSLQDAVDAFITDACNILFNLIKEYRGRKWTQAFFTDMARDDLEGQALEYKEALHNAIIEQVIYSYDNGDSQARASIEEQKSYSAYAPKAVAELWDLILNW